VMTVLGRTITRASRQPFQRCDRLPSVSSFRRDRERVDSCWHRS
jgi:hypothetical protein